MKKCKCESRSVACTEQKIMLNTIIELRKIIRKKYKFVVDSLIKNQDVNICIVCGADNNLTKEHVIPRWVFENNQEKGFITTINNMESNYCKTTLPACNRCNSILLGRLESYIKKLFEINLDLSYFSYTEQSIIIF